MKKLNDVTPEEWHQAAQKAYSNNYGGQLPLPLEPSYEETKDNYWKVNHPEHYVKGRKYEPWDVILDWNLNYFAGMALKYISRYERKGEAITDLKKAIRVLEKEIQRIKEKPNV